MIQNAKFESVRQECPVRDSKLILIFFFPTRLEKLVILFRTGAGTNIILEYSFDFIHF